jgi:hypothetical protein
VNVAAVAVAAVGRPVTMTVSGASVSTTKLVVAGVGSALPAGSVAREGGLEIRVVSEFEPRDHSRGAPRLADQSYKLPRSGPLVGDASPILPDGLP